MWKHWENITRPSQQQECNFGEPAEIWASACRKGWGIVLKIIGIQDILHELDGITDFISILDKFKTDGVAWETTDLKKKEKTGDLVGFVEEGTVRVTVADLLNQGRLVRSG